MRFAVLSDIHGNADALEAILRDVRSCGIERLLIAGDFLGYYYRADEVFALLAPWAWEGVRGNHDDAYIAFSKGLGDPEGYRKRYGHALDRALQTLPAHDHQLLATLPATRECEGDGRRILICHGAPWKHDAYIYPDASPETFVRIAALRYDVVVLGHTHYPFVRREGTTLIVNPGSVGQPRDAGGLASWIILDLSDVTATIRRVRFDPSSSMRDAQAYDPGIPYLIEVFTRTRNAYVA